MHEKEDVFVWKSTGGINYIKSLISNLPNLFASASKMLTKMGNIFLPEGKTVNWLDY